MIPLVRPVIGEGEKAAVARVLDSGMIAQGQEVAAFEAEFAGLVGDRTCVAVNSGTAALHLGLLALGIGPGDEVVLPSFTFAASGNAVRLVGAEPVFVDIDAASFCLDPGAVAEAVGPRTAAIMAVHLYGHPAAMDRLAAIAARHGLALVEDAAQAHGASFDGQPVGALGDLAAFSFYPSKNMTTAEGGMVTTADEQVARRVRLLRNQGMEHAYYNEVVGFNCRMTDIAAAMGRVQLEQLPAWTKARQANATFLDGRLEGVRTPPVANGVNHVYHQYTVRSAQRDALRQHLTDEGIGAGVYYPVPVHRLPSFALTIELPETELAAAEALSLPVRPNLTSTELERIVEVVNAHG